MASERDEARISAIKKQIIGAFTTKAMLDYEHHVDHNIDYLMKRLATSEEREVNIAEWHVFFAFDTICNIAFSDNQGLMEKQADMGNTLAGARQRFSHWHAWQSLPWLEKLLHKNRWAVKRSIGNSTSSILGQLAMDRLEARLQKGGAGTDNDLLDRFLQAWERDPATFNKGTVAGLILSMVCLQDLFCSPSSRARRVSPQSPTQHGTNIRLQIHAGADTTSATINVTLYHLLHSPHCLATLKAELDAANLSSPPTWTEVSKLRYLEACFKEASRLHPLLIDPIEREVPTPGLTIAGTFVPGGNVVAINTHALNHDPDVWGEAVDEYRPGRWIDCDEDQLQKMERANLLFSGGSRLCIGQHVAWIEMKKFLPELLMRFDVSFCLLSRARRQRVTD